MAIKIKLTNTILMFKLKHQILIRFYLLNLWLSTNTISELDMLTKMNMSKRRKTTLITEKKETLTIEKGMINTTKTTKKITIRIIEKIEVKEVIEKIEVIEKEEDMKKMKNPLQ